LVLILEETSVKCNVIIAKDTDICNGPVGNHLGRFILQKGLKPKIPNKKMKIQNREAHKHPEGQVLLKIKTGIVEPEAELHLEKESMILKRQICEETNLLVQLTLNRTLLRAFLDSGAQVSLVTEEYASLLERNGTFQTVYCPLSARMADFSVFTYEYYMPQVLVVFDNHQVLKNLWINLVL
ncbi:MAG: hypothetical protein GY861_27895, partial [bacterium]|nr:hypothetical protein [bacterium]